MKAYDRFMLKAGYYFGRHPLLADLLYLAIVATVVWKLVEGRLG